jgi:ArsR family transcriptional regulator
VPNSLLHRACYIAHVTASVARSIVGNDNPDDEFVTVFAALSDPIRLQMLRMIIQYGYGQFPCTAFDDELPIAKSTISYHVQILRRANLISVHKEGRNSFYRLRAETLEYFAPTLLEHLRGKRAVRAR